jgi:excisionase family DNA binding protein
LEQEQERTAKMPKITVSTRESYENITNSSIVRMEGVKEAAELFGLSKHLVRTLALDGKIKAVRIGKSKNGKILINIQSLNDYFNSSIINTEPEHYGNIKPIPVNL